MDEKKVQIRSNFQEFAQDFYGQQFGEIGPLKQGFALTRYYVEKIHNRTSKFISEDDFDYACVDGADDLGIDMIFRDDGVVYIYQSKYKAKVGATQEEIENFQSIIERLVSGKFRKNRRLVDKVSEIQWDTDTFVLKFICLGKIEASAKIQTSRRIRIPSDLEGLEERLQVDYLDDARLNEELRAAMSQEAGIPGELILYSVGSRKGRTPIIEVPSLDHPSYVIVVSVTQIVDMYKRARDSLFTLNIRNYIGNTGTNKAIIQTVKGQPQHFFHFNNGISCLAKKVTVNPDDGKIVTDGLQVINGAQTVKALARAASDHSLDGNASVLVRITHIGQTYGAEGRFSSDVTRYNNTQNVIKVSDFRSNDPIQIDLTDKFSELRQHGKKVDYLPKRTDRRKSQSIPIRLEEFAKVVYSFLGDPVRFSSTTSFLFDTSENGGYRTVFGDGKEIWQVMPSNDFRLRSAVWWMASEFAERLKKDKKTISDSIILAALERKWFLIFCARLLLQASNGEDEYRTSLSKHWEGNWEMGEGKVGELFEKLYESAKGAIVFIYKQESKRDSFSHRNWMRSSSSVEIIREYIQSAPIYKDLFKGI